MLKKIFTSCCVAVVVMSCSFFSPFGKKVTINNSLEIYIKGDKTTEADAKKLGNYLAETWKDITNKKSFQLIKENNSYIVKMVVDEAKVKADSSLDVSFMALRMLIADEVFKGSKVKLVLTNNEFKDIKTFDEPPTTISDAKKDSMGIK
jgi:hypothetical protein